MVSSNGLRLAHRLARCTFSSVLSSPFISVALCIFFFFVLMCEQCWICRLLDLCWRRVVGDITRQYAIKQGDCFISIQRMVCMNWPSVIYLLKKTWIEFLILWTHRGQRKGLVKTWAIQIQFWCHKINSWNRYQLTTPFRVLSFRYLASVYGWLRVMSLY